MTAWSQSEADRTLEEAKQRSVIDPEFRALALSNAMAALAKINPRPIPADSVRFVESLEDLEEIGNSSVLVVVLPPPGTSTDELSLEELENAAGGGGGTGFIEQE